MLSLGLARPSRLVDVNGLDLAGVERGNGTAVVGALTRHRELERSARVAELLPLAAEAAAYIGNPRVRNRGTFGGSLSHADPSAELCAVALAYGGRAILVGSEGERAVDFDHFLIGFFETAAAPDELLVRAELDLPPGGSGAAYVEIANRADDFATAAAAAVVTLDERGDRCDHARLVIAGAGGRSVRVPDAEELCSGEAIRDGSGVLAAVARTVAHAAPSDDDPFLSAAYRSRCLSICAVRALRTAFERARTASL
jgi:carbon-monoxide dehydrogenase medium subunit